jgi:hypothetical protein
MDTQTPPSPGANVSDAPGNDRVASPPGDTQPPNSGERLAPSLEGDLVATGPEGPPADPFMPADWTDDDWQDMAERSGMEVGDLKAAYAPARELVHSLGPELEQLFSADGELSHLGDSGPLIAALGKLGADLRVYRDGVSGLKAALQGFGWQGREPAIAPLRGEALEHAIEAMMSRYVPDPGARRMLQTDLMSHPRTAGIVRQLATALYTQEQRLSALHRTRGELREREPMPVSQPSTKTPQAARESLDQQADELWLQWRDADQAGDTVKANLYKHKLAQVDRQRFGG